MSKLAILRQSNLLLEPCAYKWFDCLGSDIDVMLELKHEVGRRPEPTKFEGAGDLLQYVSDRPY